MDSSSTFKKSIRSDSSPRSGCDMGRPTPRRNWTGASLFMAPSIGVDLDNGALGISEKDIPHTTFAREPQIDVFGRCF